MRFVQLILKNFQAHEHLIVDFGQTTCVRGQTDVGKSAVLRALRWVCLNDIGGEEFITHGKRQCLVCLKVKIKNELHIIWRIRGGGENVYKLDGQEFKAFGNSVPEPIARLLNVSGINFQSQHDSPYWFTESAGEVSRRLNSIVDLSVIDTALSYAASEVRTAQDRLNVCEERAIELKNEYDELEPQRGRIKDFDALQQCNQAQRRAEKTFCALGRILSAIHSHQETAVKPPPDFSEVKTAFGNWRKLRDTVNDLKERVANIKSMIDRRTRYTTEQVNAKNKLHKATKGQKCPLCKQIIKDNEH